MKIRSKMWSRLFVTFTALLVGAPAVQAQSDSIQVLASDEFYDGSSVAVHTNSFEVISDPNGKLVVTIGSETAATISSVTYGGVALSEAANTGTSRLAAVYYLDDPVAGTDDLVVTFSTAARSRIGAASLGNAADGVSVTADAVAASTISLSVDLTTIATDTLVIAAFSQNDQNNGTDTQPYSAGEQISHGDSGSSFTSTGYVQVPEPSGPTTYTWTIGSAESCDAVLAGFASAGAIPSDPIQVLASAGFYDGSSVAVHTNSFEVISDPNGKLVVTIGAELNGSISGVTYGGVALTAAIDNNAEAYRVAAVYYLDDPDAGTDDLVVTFSGAVRSRIGAVSLGNAADGVSVTADAVAASTASLSVDLTTIAKDTLVIAAFSQNAQGNGTITQPYSAGERISHGDSGSSFTSTGYVQVPEPSGPTTYTWTITSPETCDAVLAGFASAGAIPSDPIQVLASAGFYDGSSVAVHTNSFEVISDPNGKLVVTIGAEGGQTINSVTYGGVALSEAIDNNHEANRIAGVYYLDDPVAGTNDLVVIFSGAVRTRIGAVSLGNAADGVSVTAGVAAGSTASLSVDLTTIKKDTLVIAAFTQNDHNNGTNAQPYSAGERISHGNSGSSFTSTGYVQMPEPSGPTTYTWTITSPETCDAVLAGFASAGAISFVPTSPVQVRNAQTQFEDDTSDNIHTFADFRVIDAVDSKLVVTVGGEGTGDATSVTYGGDSLTLAESIISQDVSIWYLDDPVAGDADIVVTLTNNKESRIVALSLGNAADGIGSSTSGSDGDIVQLDLSLATVSPNTLLIGAFVNNGAAISSTPFDLGETVVSSTSGSSNMDVGYITEADIINPAATYSWVNAGSNRSSAVFIGISPVGVVAPLGDLSTFDKPLVAVTPTIDGINTLGEWGDAFELSMLWPDLGILPNVGSISYTGNDGSGNPTTEADATEADISAVFFLKWDATNLYILAEVTDDSFIKPFAGGGGYPDDHFLLGIDPDVTDGDAAASIFLAEIFINSADVTSASFLSGQAIADPALNDFTNHILTGSAVAGGYVIELALNWADLGVTGPVSGDMIGVSMLLIDNDVDDGDRDIIMSSIGNVTVPSEYHQVTLAGAMNTFANYISQYEVGILDQPTDDPDLDEVDNFTEYALGGDPSVSDAPSIQPVGELAIQGEDDVFAYTYNRRIGATALGLSYAVKGKTDLTGPTWSTTGITDEVETETLDDEFEAVTATTPMTEDNKFLRLEIN
jgi:hypothetical protein